MCLTESTATENHQETINPHNLGQRNQNPEQLQADRAGQVGQHSPRVKRRSSETLEDREALLDPGMASSMELPTTAGNSVQNIIWECQPLRAGKSNLHCDQTGDLHSLHSVTDGEDHAHRCIFEII